MPYVMNLGYNYKIISVHKIYTKVPFEQEKLILRSTYSIRLN